MPRAFVMAVVSAGIVQASTVPRSMSSDHRVKLVAYDANNIVNLKGHYGYQTQITFANGEQVQSVSLGDSLAWQAVPVSNYLFIKPIAASKTNMTVITNLHSYTFQLDSETQEATPTYKLQFTYPADYATLINTNNVGNLNPGSLNWKYSFTGEKTIAPVKAFDNNQFTYFKFNTKGLGRLPAVFMVDRKKNESLVNYHMEGDYLVVHGVGRQFTLRHGDEIASVYNDGVIGDWNVVKGV